MELTDFASSSFSQEGEDMVLKRIFEGKKTGLYVDVGAHHPFRFSNTYFFYKMGWKGINIDPIPGVKDLFDKYRPNDINLDCGISNKEEFSKFYVFNEPALNTFDKLEADSKDGIHNGMFYIVDELNLKTKKLSNILETYLPKDSQIDFLNIDVEGLDYEVLLSNNWELYLPNIILVEELKFDFENLHVNKIYNFLNDKGYKLICRTYNTSFYSRL